MTTLVAAKNVAIDTVPIIVATSTFVLFVLDIQENNLKFRAALCDHLFEFGKWL